MKILVTLCFLISTSVTIEASVQQSNNNLPGNLKKQEILNLPATKDDLKGVVGDLVEINGNYYFISAAEVSFAEAVQGCYDINMKLISVQSEAKQLMLEEFFEYNRVYDSQLFWTSGIRYSGSEFMWSSTGQPFTYTNWYPYEEPDESSTIPDVFVVITHRLYDRTWIDTENNSFNFICEQRDKLD